MNLSENDYADIKTKFLILLEEIKFHFPLLNIRKVVVPSKYFISTEQFNIQCIKFTTDLIYNLELLSGLDLHSTLKQRVISLYHNDVLFMNELDHLLSDIPQYILDVDIAAVSPIPTSFSSRPSSSSSPIRKIISPIKTHKQYTEEQLNQSFLTYDSDASTNESQNKSIRSTHMDILSIEYRSTYKRFIVSCLISIYDSTITRFQKALEQYIAKLRKRKCNVYHYKTIPIKDYLNDTIRPKMKKELEALIDSYMDEEFDVFDEQITYARKYI